MYDVVVIGGGGMGCSAALHLAHPPHGARVAVIERDISYEDAQTFRAGTGGVRRLHSLPENIALSNYSIPYYQEFARHTEVDGVGTDAEFVEGGYLVTASPEGVSNFAANFDLQRAAGVEVYWLDPVDVATRFPMVRVEGIGAALHSPRDGWANPHRVLEGLRRKALSLGVEFLNDEVLAFERGEQRIRSITLASGQTICAPAFVLAAGPWSGKLAARAGVDIPVGPLLRYDFDFETGTPPKPQPFIRDWARVAFRAHGTGYRGGVQSTDMPRSFQRAIDPAFFENAMLPALRERVRGFDSARMVHATVGWFDFNAFDQNALIGPCTGVADNLYLLTGFSGHGFMHIPGAGRAIAELIMHGEFRTIDLSRFGWHRLVKNEPYRHR